MGRSPKNGTGDVAVDSPVLSVDELCERYPEEWMVIEVTERNQYTHATAGRLLAHHKWRSRISPAVVRALGERKPIYVFYGVKLVSSAEVSAYFDKMINDLVGNGRTA